MFRRLALTLMLLATLLPVVGGVLVHHCGGVAILACVCDHEAEAALARQAEVHETATLCCEDHTTPSSAATVVPAPPGFAEVVLVEAPAVPPPVIRPFLRARDAAWPVALARGPPPVPIFLRNASILC